MRRFRSRWRSPRNADGRCLPGHNLIWGTVRAWSGRGRVRDAAWSPAEPTGLRRRHLGRVAIPAVTAAVVLALSVAAAVARTSGPAATAAATSGNVITSASVGIPQEYNTGAAEGTPQGTRAGYTNGDTWYNTWGANGDIFSTSDDSNGFNGNCSNNFVVNEISGDNPSDLSSPFDNCMTSYGTEGDQQDYGDGASWKTDGIISVDGTLYVIVARQIDGRGGYPYGFQPSSNASIIESTDGGQTWSNGFGTTDDPTGAVPPYNPQLGRADATWPGTSFDTPEFIQYGQDDNPASTADGGDTYVYAISNNGFAYDGSDMVLGRVLRSQIGDLDGSDWQYYDGPPGGDGMSSADWTSNVADAKPVLKAPYQLSQSGINYIQPLHLYIMTSFYFPFTSTWPSSGVTSYWDFYEAPHPWGPWTRFFNEPSTECYFSCSASNTSQLGLYDPNLVSKFISMDGLSDVVFSTGDWTSPSRPNDYLYHLHAWPFTLTTTTQQVVDDTNPAIQYSGAGWSFTRDDGGYYDDTDHYSDHGGDTDVASFTFTGTSIAWVGAQASNHGYAAVSIDGGSPTTVDTYSATTQYQQVVFQQTGLSPGKHTITITVLDQKDSQSSGTYTDIDAFIVGGPG